MVKYGSLQFTPWYLMPNEIINSCRKENKEKEKYKEIKWKGDVTQRQVENMIDKQCTKPQKL
jgi:hypothetical protein